MIKLFGVTDKEYGTNGDVVIVPLKAKVHKEDNGAFYLDLETDLSYSDHIVENNIIVAPTPQGEQAFRVGNVEKTRRKITTKAYHVFYDSKNYLIEDSYVFEKNCNDALEHLNQATSDASPFTTSSDVGVIANFRCVRRSLYEAIETVLERWGGHLVRDNWDIEIKETIGQDNGVVVRYAKNLKEITSTENWDNVVTKLLPVGKDGILLNELNSSASLYVMSSVQYAVPYTKKLNFSQDDVLEDDYKDGNGDLDVSAYNAALIEDLRQQAQSYVDANCTPQINYTLKANLEQITDIGDVIEVIDERLGINLFTNVIAYEYDCILGKYTELEFGNFKNTLSNLVSNITGQTAQEIENANQTLQITINGELQQSTDAIRSLLSDSYVIYEGDKILILDRLPKESAVNVIKLDNFGLSFSSGGVAGAFTNVWDINGSLNMGNINILNLTANLIKGGAYKLGSNLNSLGVLEVYDSSNRVIATLNKDGLKVIGTDNSYILINENVGVSGFDQIGDKVFWWESGEFHVKKGAFEEEITLFNKFKLLPITITDSQANVINDGIGLIAISNN